MRSMAGGSVPFSQHADEHSLERPVLLAVDRQLDEGCGSAGSSNLADFARSLEVGSIRTRRSSARGAGPGAGLCARPDIDHPIPSEGGHEVANARR
jgi:hypothetical protein